MNELTDNLKVKELSDKIDSLILGCKIGVVALLVLFTLINLLDSFAISLFRHTYIYSLGPDHPLPGLTLIFLDWQTFVTGLAVLWPLLGTLATVRLKKVCLALSVPTVLLAIIIGQIVLTWLGLLLPMVSITNGISDSH